VNVTKAKLNPEPDVLIVTPVTAPPLTEAVPVAKPSPSPDITTVGADV
jgi:hypothetical protein